MKTELKKEKKNYPNMKTELKIEKKNYSISKLN